jgi:hypothetical protein
MLRKAGCNIRAAADGVAVGFLAAQNQAQQKTTLYFKHLQMPKR